MMNNMAMIRVSLIRSVQSIYFSQDAYLDDDRRDAKLNLAQHC